MHPASSPHAGNGWIRRIGIPVFVLVVCAVFFANGITGALNGIWLGQGGATLSLEETLSGAEEASDLFVVTNITGDDGGIETLIDLMNRNGLPFYDTAASGDPNGLIGRNDVVIIKVNCQWSQRGGTNTDLVKGLIRAIANHPGGFSGEIVIADNGQEVGNLDWSVNNAEDHAQSFEDVAASLAGTVKVSTYLWDTITTTSVGEYDKGDMRDGYIVNTAKNPVTGIYVSYPKFTTKYGTRISLKYGIWDPVTHTYDTARLKLINIPVLKSHNGAGVTGAVKHYMGVVSIDLTGKLGMNSHNTVYTGGMGTQLVETRFPALSIIDAIWVNARPLEGPFTPYAVATRLNVIAAGTDPVALDAWAARSLLIPTARNLGYTDVSSMDPDYRVTRSFGYWLELSRQELQKAGYFSTSDAGSMNVYLAEHGGTGVAGDLDGDGTVSWGDIVKCAYMAWNMIPDDPAADFSDPADGVDWGDVLKLTYYYWGLIPAL